MSLGPYTHVGGLQEVPGFWLQLDSSLDVAATGGVNQQMEDLPLSFFYLGICLLSFVLCSDFPSTSHLASK